MKISLESKKRRPKTSSKADGETDIGELLSLEINDFKEAISRDQLIAVVIEQQNSKKYSFRVHTLDHPHGIVLVTRRNKKKPRAFKTVDKTIEVFTTLTGFRVFTDGAEIYGGMLVVPFTTDAEVLHLGPKK